jgi:hypothetical protein
MQIFTAVPMAAMLFWKTTKVRLSDKILLLCAYLMPPAFSVKWNAGYPSSISEEAKWDARVGKNKQLTSTENMKSVSSAVSTFLQ